MAKLLTLHGQVINSTAYIYISLSVSLYIYIYLSLSLSHSVSLGYLNALSLSVSLSVSLSLSLHLSLYLSLISLYISVCISLSLWPAWGGLASSWQQWPLPDQLRIPRWCAGSCCEVYRDSRELHWCYLASHCRECLWACRLPTQYQSRITKWLGLRGLSLWTETAATEPKLKNN